MNVKGLSESNMRPCLTPVWHHRSRLSGAIEASLVGGVCALAVLIWYPLTQHFWFESHEGDSYIMRSVQYLEGLRSGELYPRWAGDLYGGFGAPFFIFYPPLVYALSALSAPLLGSVVFGLKGVALLATLTAGVSMYLLARHETGRPDAALVAAGAYLAAPYRVWDLYGRGDLAEYTALAFLPLALYGYRRVSAEPVLSRATWFAGLATLAHAACVLSHTLIGFYGTGLLLVGILASAWSLWSRDARRHVLLLMVAFAFALALSAVYTLPAAFEKDLVRIDSMHAGDFSPSNHWLTVSKLVDRKQFFFLPPVALAALFVLIIGRRLGKKSLLTLVYLSVAIVVLGLQLPQAAGFWTLSPLLTIIQFPWRLLGPGWIALSVCFALIWSSLVRAPLSVRALAATQLGWVLALGCLQWLHLDPADANGSQLSVEVLRNRLNATTGLDEYLPRNVERRPVQPATSVVAMSAPPSVRTEWEINSNSRHVIDLTTDAFAIVPLNLHDYPGWELEAIGDLKSVSLTTTVAGHLALRLEQAGHYRLAVSFQQTLARKLASWISWTGLILLIPALLCAGKVRPGRSRVMFRWWHRVTFIRHRRRIGAMS